MLKRHKEIHTGIKPFKCDVSFDKAQNFRKYTSVDNLLNFLTNVYTKRNVLIFLLMCYLLILICLFL